MRQTVTIREFKNLIQRVRVRMSQVSKGPTDLVFGSEARLYIADTTEIQKFE